MARTPLRPPGRREAGPRARNTFNGQQLETRQVQEGFNNLLPLNDTELAW